MIGQALLRLFPTPHYLLQPTVGLDISDRSIKFIELREKGNRPYLSRFGEKEIPEGAIVGGSIQDLSSVSRVFREIKETFGFTYATVSLPEEKAYVINLSIKGVRLSDLRESVELQIEDHVPFPASHVVFDYDVVRAQNGVIDVVVSVLPKQVVESYLNALTASEIQPLVFEIEAQAATRALIEKGSKETILIVDFGRMRSGFTIVDQGVARYSSTVAVGGDTIVRAIRDRFHIKEEVARKMKEERGLRRKIDEDLFFAITPSAGVLRDEVEKYLLYWEHHRGEEKSKRPPVNKVIITGGDANIPGFLDYLASGFDIPFVLANPWINFLSFDDAIPSISHNHVLRYTTAIGLALRRTALFSCV